MRRATVRAGGSGDAINAMCRLVIHAVGHGEHRDKLRGTVCLEESRDDGFSERLTRSKPPSLLS